jgi:hypothetical protein
MDAVNLITAKDKKTVKCFVQLASKARSKKMEQKIQLHKELIDYLHNLYITKNADYGDSVHDTFEKYGLTSFLVRLEDKLNRARTLSTKKAMVSDEKIEDTLLDMANYAILAVIELRTKEDTNGNQD